jgi:RNA polymerase sigma-70 factor (ECF subfamily)
MGTHARMASTRSDHELLAAWRAGDAKAGTRLFKRHFVAIRRFVQTTVEASAVEPLIQAVFAGFAHEHAATSVRVALLGRAYALVLDHHRAHASSPLDPERDSVAELVAARAGSTGDRLALPSNESRALLDALHRVPLATQVLLQLRYWEQLSSAELSELFGVEANELFGRLGHGRALLERTLRRSSPSEMLDTLRELDERSAPLDDPPLASLMPATLGGCPLVEHRVVARQHRFEYRDPALSIELCLSRVMAGEAAAGEPLAVRGYRGRWAWEAATQEGRAWIQLGNNALELRVRPAAARERVLELLGELELPLLARVAGLIV